MEVGNMQKKQCQRCGGRDIYRSDRGNGYVVDICDDCRAEVSVSRDGSPNGDLIPWKDADEVVAVYREALHRMLEDEDLDLTERDFKVLTTYLTKVIELGYHEVGLSRNQLATATGLDAYACYRSQRALIRAGWLEPVDEPVVLKNQRYKKYNGWMAPTYVKVRTSPAQVPH
jgi:hypothetical protein